MRIHQSIHDELFLIVYDFGLLQHTKANDVHQVIGGDNGMYTVYSVHVGCCLEQEKKKQNYEK